MHLYETGSNRWINAARYPMVRATTPLRLAGGGTLSAKVPAGEGAETLVFGDPALPGRRISFTSEPFAQGATIAGPIGATFYASATTRNTLLLARLHDVAPDGTATLLSRGVVLGSQSESDPAQSWRDARGAVIWPWQKLDRDKYLTPGRVYRMDMSLEPIQHALKPGHRLRLDLTTQAPNDICPLDRLPTPGNNDPCRGTKAQVESLAGGTYTIRFGRRYPSTLNLPQAPLNAFATVASGPPPTPPPANAPAGRRNAPFTLPRDWGR